MENEQEEIHKIAIKNKVPAVKKVKKKKNKKKTGRSKAEYPKKTPEGTQTKKQRISTYLNDWQTNRDRWKYQKNLEAWLVKNFLKAPMLRKSEFKIFLLYMADKKGSALQRCRERSQLMISNYESITDAADKKKKYAKLKRAKKILRL